MFLQQKSQTADFIHCDFAQAFKLANTDTTFYADPSYCPVSKTASFTHYSHIDFNFEDHLNLVDSIKHARKKGASTLISNSHTEASLNLYQSADLIEIIEAKRSIAGKKNSCNTVHEILALFNAK